MKLQPTHQKNIKHILSITLCAVLFVGISVFAFTKTKFLFKGVQIVATVEQTTVPAIARIIGNAKNATYISLNGREIFIDKNGNFSEPIALLPGLSVVTIDAQDKFGKTMEKRFELVYTEQTGVVALGNTINNKN
jgi:hypothetical protein